MSHRRLDFGQASLQWNVESVDSLMNGRGPRSARPTNRSPREGGWEKQKRGEVRSRNDKDNFYTFKRKKVLFVEPGEESTVHGGPLALWLSLEPGTGHATCATRLGRREQKSGLRWKAIQRQPSSQPSESLTSHSSWNFLPDEDAKSWIR